MNMQLVVYIQCTMPESHI